MTIQILEFRGVVEVKELDVEYTVIEVPELNYPYHVEGFIDLSSLTDNDTIEICEYVAVDGKNQRKVYCDVYSGTQTYPILHFRPILVPKDGKYKVTIKQTAGSPKSFPYWFYVNYPNNVILIYLVRRWI